MAYRFAFFEKILEPSPLAVIHNGKFIRRNMRAEYITHEDLLSLLRQQGIQAVGEVKLAYIEPDGALSVVRYGAGRRSVHGNAHKSSGLR